MSALSRKGKEFIVKNKKGIQRLARFGYSAKGITYCLVGLLSCLAAFGWGGKKAGRSEAFETLYDQPLGQWLLIFLALGLFCYCAWRLFLAIKNPENASVWKRLGHIGSGLLYLSFGVSALGIAFKSGKSSGGSRTVQIIGEILSQPVGQFFVLAIALFTFVKAITQFYKAYTGEFSKDVYIEGSKENLFHRTGVLGYTARGIVLIIIAYFFARAGWYQNKNEVQDTEGSFNFLETFPYGDWLMGAVAFGVICYGVFMFVKARYGSFKL